VQPPSEAVVAVASAAVAAAACLAAYADGRSGASVRPRVRLAVAAVLALAALISYFHFFNLPGRGFYHRWEMYHYFVGAKYAPELGYERLYACTLIADAEELGRERVASRRIRNLADDSLMAADEVLREPERCKARFSSERWQSFRQDVGFFRQAAANRWELMQADHGYNPSPVWTAGGRALTSLGSANEAFVQGLALIDPILMLAVLAAFAWAFGWRIAALAAIFWGTQAAAPFTWTGGGLLRQDWLLACVLAVALLRKRHFFWAGFALATAGLLRVFPILLWLGPVLLVARDWMTKRSLDPRHRRLLAGGAVAAALLVPAGALAAGPGAYAEFARHTVMHAATPITNHMSLRTLFSAGDDTRLERHFDRTAFDPVEPWAEARRARLERNRIYYWLAAALLLGLFVHTVRRLRTPWIALGLSLLPIIALTDPSCYYYSLWILLAPLALARRSLEVVLLGLAAIGQLVALQVTAPDQRYVALAALYVLFTTSIVLGFARPPAWTKPAE
jgi:hypothetical protein